MRLDDQRRSSNVEDQRGGGLGLPVIGGGIGTIIIVIVAALFGVNPRALLQQGNAPARQQAPAPAQAGTTTDPQADFVAAVLGDTEDVWHAYFREHLGRDYQEPHLVLFTGAVQSACGFAQAATGPFYCPVDGKVYIDLQFYRELKERFSAPGDFAQAYVIAHEVGHHVQNLLGTSEKVHDLEQRGSERQANELSVRLELQADCYGRRLGQSRAEDEEHPRAGRRRGSAERRDRDRRRPPADAIARLRHARFLHARHLGPARVVVQARIRGRRATELRDVSLAGT